MSSDLSGHQACFEESSRFEAASLQFRKISYLILTSQVSYADYWANYKFDNYVPNAGVDAPVYDANGIGLDSFYYAELWGGPTPDMLEPGIKTHPNLLQNVRCIIPFYEDGYFLGNQEVHVKGVSDLEFGLRAWLEVRAWDGRLGETYEEVVSLGIGGYGASELFYAQGGSLDAILPELGYELRGLESFSLLPVIPEPTTWALVMLGGSALAWRMNLTRKKKGSWNEQSVLFL